MSQKILILDYGMGNIHSLSKKLSNFKINSIISDSYIDLQKADKIILPGVGHFGKAMNNLIKMKYQDALNEVVLVHKKPILGICLGMQLMALESEEGNAAGLGWFDAKVQKFNVNNTIKYKVPHVGWNQVSIQKNSLLMKEIPDNSEFYFVHSYHFVCNQQIDVLNISEYDYKFVSAVEKDNIFGVQYHPEKSHVFGEQLLKNFILI